jgi:hypothetical protein
MSPGVLLAIAFPVILERSLGSVFGCNSSRDGREETDLQATDKKISYARKTILASSQLAKNRNYTNDADFRWLVKWVVATKH